MNVSFPPVNQFVNQAAHSASESIGTLASRFVSLFQNRSLSDVTLIVANLAFTVISALIAIKAMELFENSCRGYFANERGRIPEGSYFSLAQLAVGATSFLISFTVMNSALTRMLKMPISRVSTIAIALISAIGAFGLLKLLPDND